MKAIKFKLSIDPTNNAAVVALHALLLAMKPNDTVAANLPQRKTVKETPVMEVHTVSNNANTASMEIETPANEEPEETNGNPADVETDLGVPTATLEEIREVLGKKVGEHREAIKNQLTKLNAKNVSVLATEHYDSFKAFLDKL